MTGNSPRSETDPDPAAAGRRPGRPRPRNSAWDWLVGVFLALTLVLLQLKDPGGWLEALDRVLFDVAARLSAREVRPPQIELVTISREDLGELGPWPWRRDVLAQGIRRIALAGPRVIALNLALAERQADPGFLVLQRLKRNYESSGLGQEGAGLAFYRELSAALGELDQDARLYAALEAAENVVLPVRFDFQPVRGDGGVPGDVLRHAFSRSRVTAGAAGMRAARHLQPMAAGLLEIAAGVGHSNDLADRDRVLRRHTLLVDYLSRVYVPSFPLAIALAYWKLKVPELKLALNGEDLRLEAGAGAARRIQGVDGRAEAHIRWRAEQGSGFSRTPFSRLLGGEEEAAVFKDRIVIVGPVSDEAAGLLNTPLGARVPGLEIIAQAVSNILEGGFMIRPAWGGWAEWGVFIAAALVVSFAFPGLRILPRMGFCLVLLAVAGFFFFRLHASGIRLQPAASLLLLAGGTALLSARQLLLRERAPGPDRPAAGTPSRELLPLGRSPLVGVLGFEELRALPLEARGVKEKLYDLALAMEERGRAEKALDIYRFILHSAGTYRDVAERAAQLAPPAPPAAAGPAPEAGPGVLARARALSITKLYEPAEVVELLPLGAVLRGNDGSRGHPVSIRILGPGEGGEGVWQRQREQTLKGAEVMGSLDHPGVLKVHAWGEEDGLAYVVSEAFEGADLAEHLRRNGPLELWAVLTVIARAAEALDHVHRRNIVHGCIRPASILWDPASGTMRLTGFAGFPVPSLQAAGSAHYLSPEQVSGRRIDGRSDIFSLGAVLYECLTGARPFAGEDLSSLMLRIVKESHPSPRGFGVPVPRMVEEILDICLAKDPDERYERACAAGERSAGGAGAYDGNLGAGRAVSRPVKGAGMRILGIDTSCDDTSAGVVAEGRQVLSNVVQSQVKLHRPHGGVVPELASREHLRTIVPVVEASLSAAGLRPNQLDGIAVTVGPGLVGSLLVGLYYAKALAFVHGLPLAAVNHLEGHILSVFLEERVPPFPFVALTVAGGHTSLYRVDGFGRYKPLGQTLDDAAGEAFDKVAKILGLGYPGGAVIETLAAGGRGNRIPFPRALLSKASLDFSFSGLKTAVALFVKEWDHDGSRGDVSRADIAASFQEAVVEVLVQKALQATLAEGTHSLAVAGGVACNGRLRARLQEAAEGSGIEIFCPRKAYCTDNGAMIAVAGYHRLSRGERAALDMDVRSKYPIDTLPVPGPAVRDGVGR